MAKDKSFVDKNKNMDVLLRDISSTQQTPIFFYFCLLGLYVLATVFLQRIAHSEELIMLAGKAVPVSMFTGVFSSIGNICIILIAVFYNKLGYITGLVVIIGQFPMVLRTLVIQHNYTAISGVFSNLLAIIAISIVFFNNRRIGKYQARMREQAVTDMLTGLPNRFACTELIGRMIKQKVKFALVSVDLNNFKSINDTMGHEVGNEVLIEIASRWKKIADSWQSGTNDFVARFGGDEYGIIIGGYKTEQDILDAINIYKEELEKTITLDDCDYYFNAAFGYATCPDDTKDVGTLVSYADAAMHKAKSIGGEDMIYRFTSDLSEAENELEVERKIRTALEEDNIMFNLQPQYDMNHKLRGFEALARMKDSDGSIIPPGVFIPVAEKIGLIDQVDSAVFRKAAEFLGDALRTTDITLSINVSVRHLMKNDFVDEIKGMVERYNIPPEHLEVEITESIMIDSVEKAFKCIDEIKEMGIMIAIDDFGTGYSSLSYLNEFPADLLKIDKSFIDVMNLNESNKQYVATIVSIGHILNLKVISEGVEDDEQIETLRSIGCDYIQGFVWGKPLSPEEAAKLF